MPDGRETPATGFLQSNFLDWFGDSWKDVPGGKPPPPDPIMEWRKNFGRMRALLGAAILWCPKCKGRRIYRKHPCSECLEYVQAIAQSEETR